MGIVIRRRQTVLGEMDVRIKTNSPNPRLQFEPDPRKYWMEELSSGKPYVRFKATYQHPKKGLWGSTENPEAEPCREKEKQAELARKYLQDREKLNRLMTEHPIA